MDTRDRPVEVNGTLRESASTNERCLCKLCLLAFLAIVTAPYRRTFKLYTWRPLQEMRAARGDRDILVPLIRQWKAEKYEELRSVQVSVRSHESLHQHLLIIIGEFLCWSCVGWNALVQNLGRPLDRNCTLCQLPSLFYMGNHLLNPSEVNLGRLTCERRA